MMGIIREPFFRHHASTDCESHTNGNRGDYPIARRMLYQLAKRSYPEAQITCSKNFKPFIADIYVQQEDMKLAIEYLSYDMKLKEWLDKHAFYEEQGIIDVWFLNSKKYRFEAPTTFEYLISTKKQILNILDTMNQEVTLKKILRLPGQSVGEVIAKTYFLPKLIMDTTGCLNCDFDSYLQMRGGTKLKQQQERLEKYPDSLKIAMEKRRQIETTDNVNDSEVDIDENTKGNFEFEALSVNQVYRYPLENQYITVRTMRMPAINECWIIPQLRGNSWEIESGHKERYEYLHTLDNRLAMLEDEEQKEQMIDEAIFYLEEMLEAKMWR